MFGCALLPKAGFVFLRTLWGEQASSYVSKVISPAQNTRYAVVTDVCEQLTISSNYNGVLPKWNGNSVNSGNR